MPALDDGDHAVDDVGRQPPRGVMQPEQQRRVAVQPLDLVLLGVAVAAVDAEGVLDALLAFLRL